MSFSGLTATICTRLNAEGYPGLYIHVPFCERKCPYCAFYSCENISQDVIRAYCDRVIEEILLLPVNSFDTLYIGGGTPSVIPLSIMQFFSERLFSTIQTAQLHECTIEINPCHTSVSYIHALLEMGFNRFSFGIQSFNAEKLKILGRKHSMADITRVIDSTKYMSNYSFDLIFGFACDTRILSEELNTLLELKPPHISLYNLKIEQGTAYEKAVRDATISLSDDDAQAAQYYHIQNTLCDAGYQHYEISNFCLPGYESRHNMKYWQMTPWYGIGPAAASFVDNTLITYEHSLHDFLNMTLTRKKEALRPSDLRRYQIMMGLRTSIGVILSPEEAIRIKQNDRMHDMLLFSDNNLSIKKEFWFISNSIISEVLSVLSL